MTRPDDPRDGPHPGHHSGLTESEALRDPEPQADSSVPAAERPKRERRRYRKRLFTRDPNRGQSFILDLSSAAVFFLGLALVGLLGAGLWYGGGALWRVTRGALDDAGFPFRTHHCTAEDQSVPLPPRQVAPLVPALLDASVAEGIARRGRAWSRGDLALRTVMRDSIRVTAAWRGRPAAGVADLLVIELPSRLDVCGVLGSLGLVGAPGRFGSREDGTVVGPLSSPYRVAVDPDRGRIAEIRIVADPDR